MTSLTMSKFIHIHLINISVNF